MTRHIEVEPGIVDLPKRTPGAGRCWPTVDPDARDPSNATATATALRYIGPSELLLARVLAGLRQIGVSDDD
jgi:hypothetical protein